MVEVGSSLVIFSVAVKRSRHQNIRVAIPVYVAGTANAPTILGTFLIRLPRPGSRGRKPSGRAVVEVGSALS